MQCIIKLFFNLGRDWHCADILDEDDDWSEDGEVETDESDVEMIPV